MNKNLRETISKVGWVDQNAFNLIDIPIFQHTNLKLGLYANTWKMIKDTCKYIYIGRLCTSVNYMRHLHKDRKSNAC